MKLRLLACLALFTLLLSVVATAQVDNDFPPEDSVDTFDPADTTFNEPWESDSGSDDYSLPSRSNAFTPRSGLFGGPTIEFTTLAPHDLDPTLDGDLVLYGGEGYILINGWMIGGGGSGATLFDISSNYDQFSYGYGGFLTGYEFNIVKPFSFRFDVMIGGGGLSMIKKRPDLMAIDSSGHDILERYRSENFFMLRPGATIGFSPLPFLDFRLGANYVLPVGGKDVGDLKNLGFGLHMMFGFGG